MKGCSAKWLVKRRAEYAVNRLMLFISPLAVLTPSGSEGFWGNDRAFSFEMVPGAARRKLFLES